MKNIMSYVRLILALLLTSSVSANAQAGSILPNQLQVQCKSSRSQQQDNRDQLVANLPLYNCSQSRPDMPPFLSVDSGCSIDNRQISLVASDFYSASVSFSATIDGAKFKVINAGLRVIKPDGRDASLTSISGVRMGTASSLRLLGSRVYGKDFIAELDEFDCSFKLSLDPAA